MAGYVRLAWKRGNASVHWPTARGEILSSAVVYDGDHHQPHIEYCYRVEGQRYTCDTITYRGYTPDQNTAESFVRRYPAKSEVNVRYDPHSPDVAVLEPGVDRKTFVIAIVVLLGLFSVGIGLRIAALL